MKNRIKEKSIVKSGLKLNYAILLGFFACVFLFVAYLLLCFLIDSQFDNNFSYLLIILFSTISLYSIYTIFMFYEIEITHDFIILSSLFNLKKSIISRKEIKTWSEDVSSGKYGERRILTFFTDKFYFEISTSLHNNYDRIKHSLTKNIEGNLDIENRIFAINKYKVLVFSILLSISFLYCSYFIYSNKNISILNSEDLTTINQVVLSKEYDNHKKSNLNYIKIDKYPDIKFLVGNREMLDNLNIGDFVKIGIRNIDYQKRITHNEPFNIWDIPIPNDEMKVYTLSIKNKQIKTLDEYNSENKTNPTGSAAAYCILAIICFVYGLYSLW